jgi:hypothetical protein
MEAAAAVQRPGRPRWRAAGNGHRSRHILADGNAVRTVACPVPHPDRHRLRGARTGAAGPPQLPAPLTVRRRVSIRGAIMIGEQRIQVGLPHSGKTAEITIEADTYQIIVEGGIAITAPRTTSRDINGTRRRITGPPAAAAASPRHSGTRPQRALALQTCPG